MSPSRNVLVAPLALLIAAFFAAARWTDEIETRSRVDALRRETSRPASHGRHGDREGAPEAGVSAAATAAHLKRLVALSTTGEALSIDWESDLPSSFAFLSRLRSRGLAAGMPRLSLAGADTAGLIRGNVVVHPGASSGSPALSAPAKDPFRPLWRSEISVAKAADESLRRQDAERRRQADQAEKDRQAEALLQQRAARRQDIENRYAVTGLVTDARGPLAFLTADRQRSLLVHVGDRLDAATVSSINNKTGEVVLDAGDGVSIVLRLGGGGGLP